MKKISKLLSENLPFFFFGGKIFSILNRRVFVMCWFTQEITENIFAVKFQSLFYHKIYIDNVPIRLFLSTGN